MGARVSLVVAHVVRSRESEEVVRIISARYALKHERYRYEIQTQTHQVETYDNEANRQEGFAEGKSPDSQIDTSDIPPLADEFFRRAVSNPYYRPIKQSTTVRIDADVLAWLK